MVKLAAFDMDGTLLMPDHRLGEKTLHTLQQLAGRQVTLTFATGRHILEMVRLKTLRLPDAFLITGNGTRIHTARGEQLYACDLAPSVAEAVIHSHWDTRASMHVFNDNGWFTAQAQPGLLAAHTLSGFHYQVMDLRRIPAHQVTKICFCGDEADLRQLRVQLNGVTGGQAHLCFSARDCLEVLPTGCHKGSALRYLAEYLDVPLPDCMAFGDAMNDREMLSLVGHGVIMGNAMTELKASLPHLPVIGHCAREAVSDYLLHWLDTTCLTYSPE